ncbi:hypothetical protein D4764_15G0002020 [Takifugu flavidus]|uniref:Uncharacterized protein n=1 Tax=Takifugu flavidus TaxID=433684 RepID=A0A5C6P119_9TELE|nr:hypothetical protein D4764_15G0002020 [Takifugu flavidus]
MDGRNTPTLAETQRSFQQALRNVPLSAGIRWRGHSSGLASNLIQIVVTTVMRSMGTHHALQSPPGIQA